MNNKENMKELVSKRNKFNLAKKVLIGTAIACLAGGVVFGVLTIAKVFADAVIFAVSAAGLGIVSIASADGCDKMEKSIDATINYLVEKETSSENANSSVEIKAEEKINESELADETVKNKSTSAKNQKEDEETLSL